jgi:hypothetical protein
MEHVLISAIVLLSVFGFPSALVGLHLRQRHREKMRALESEAAVARVAALETSRADLETRVRTLESIVTTTDQELEKRLRRLEASPPAPALPPRS